MTSIKKRDEKRKSKQSILPSLLLSSEPRPGPFFDKINSDLIDIFLIMCNFQYT